MAKCRTCKAQISFVKMQTGAFMPVDPGYITVRTIGRIDNEPSCTIITDDGRAVNGIIGDDGDERGRESHFATCPEAGQHRRRR